MPRSPSTVRFACGSGKPYRMTPGVAGSPAPIECTSVVAPPGIDDDAAGRAPSRPATPSASSRAPSSTAAGVGISTRSNCALARSMPFALTMRCMNTSRIAARAGSMSSVSIAGSTLAAAIATRPLSRQHRDDLVRRFAIARDDDGQRTARRASACALCRITVGVAAVGAAAQQEDVGRERFDLRDIACGQPIGEAADEPGAGAQRRLPRGLGRQFAHETDGHHPQAARGARRREPACERRQAAQSRPRALRAPRRARC